MVLLQADARHIPLADGCVQCVVTSPPYWGLRDYGTPGQIGLEQTPDAYVAELVAVFREVRRVLRDDGVLWLNLGDSYAGTTGNTKGGLAKLSEKIDGVRRNGDQWATVRGEMHGFKRPDACDVGLKPKDLVGIPWSVAKALQAPYYAGSIARERDRVWLAAMIDGEGTICGFRHERKDDGRIRTGVHVYITNSNTALLDEAHRIWPASRSEHMSESAGHLGKRDVFRWISHGAERKANLLAELYPYLIAKRQQALIAWNLLQFVQDGKRLGRGIHGPAVRDKRDHLVRLMADANAGRSFDVPMWCEEPESMHEPGWYLRSDIIWAKPNPMPESVTDRPTKAHEYVFLLTKSERYFYDAMAISEPVSQTNGAQAWRRIFDASKQNKEVEMKAQGVKAGNDGRRDPDATDRNARTVWTIATQPYSGAHFATMPEALVERCVLAGSKPGSLVFDPFGGSGTTAAVALRLGRRAVCTELNPAYLALAERRTHVTLGLPLEMPA
jgi:DNA modification methylase